MIIIMVLFWVFILLRVFIIIISVCLDTFYNMAFLTCHHVMHDSLACLKHRKRVFIEAFVNSLFEAAV